MLFVRDYRHAGEGRASGRSRGSVYTQIVIVIGPIFTRFPPAVLLKKTCLLGEFQSEDGEMKGLSSKKMDSAPEICCVLLLHETEPSLSYFFSSFILISL